MRAHSTRLPVYGQRRPTRASVVSGHTPKQGRRHAPYATAAGGFQGLQVLSPHRWPPLGAFIKLPALRVVHDLLLTSMPYVRVLVNSNTESLHEHYMDI